MLAAVLVAAAQAQADTIDDRIPRYQGPLADALVGELAALSAFTEKHELGTIDPTQDAEARNERSTLAVIDALNAQDLDAARRIGGAQEESSEQLLASLGGVPDTEALDRIEVGDRSAEWKCLAEAMYFEARGEGVEGQVAVAEVILNRVDSMRYPDTVCDVVLQGAGNGRACQFSYNCDGLENHVANKPVYERIGKLAWLMLEGRSRTLTDDALYFHSTAVSPGWSRKYVRTAQIGRHLFYRPEVRLSQNDAGGAAGWAPWPAPRPDDPKAKLWESSAGAVPTDPG